MNVLPQAILRNNEQIMNMTTAGEENHSKVIGRLEIAIQTVPSQAGWGCTDDSEATPESRLLLTTLLLTLSNIFFLPAILVALQHHLFTEAIVLQFCDFFCSILAFWVTLIAIAGIPPHITSSLHMVAAWCIRSFQQGSCIQLHYSLLLCRLPGILLAGLGLVLFAFIETQDNYQSRTDEETEGTGGHGVVDVALTAAPPRKILSDFLSIEATPEDGAYRAPKHVGLFLDGRRIPRRLVSHLRKCQLFLSRARKRCGGFPELLSDDKITDYHGSLFHNARYVYLHTWICSESACQRQNVFTAPVFIQRYLREKQGGMMHLPGRGLCLPVAPGSAVSDWSSLFA
uniref:Uncharacterized protein n=1 Tax=Timema monikensis TaxID=170555 RepID=A0A7R9DZ00_9NEOP|nr:unnamed protein product [Timema monikensis]